MRWWVMNVRPWGVRCVRADGPCWKGEIQIGPILVGWQRAHVEAPDIATYCQECGGLYRYDTTIDNPTWNRVIRARGLPEFLCAACIVRHFALAGESFTAELWGEDEPFSGLRVKVIVRP